MDFFSILFPTGPTETLPVQAPLFQDLELNTIFTAILQGRQEYALTDFYHMPLQQMADVQYRQQVMRDITKNSAEKLEAFTTMMRNVHHLLNESEEKEDRNYASSLRLQAINTYTAGMQDLSAALSTRELSSEGMRSLREKLTGYCQQQEFLRLRDDAKAITLAMNNIQYTLYILGNGIDVKRYKEEPELDEIVQTYFTRFVQKTVQKKYTMPDYGKQFNHVKKAILEKLAELYPEVFQRLYAFCGQTVRFLPDWLLRFEREIQFYLAFHRYMQRIKKRGVAFCYPSVSNTMKEFSCTSGSDLALVQKLPMESTTVKNSFYLNGKERILIITGPNQGGKTTFARMAGQLAYLASLGLPVAAVSAHIFLPDRIFTHFERQEQEISASGKLKDDISRIHDILSQATTRSLLIINEMFASTTLQDAVDLGKAIMKQVSDTDMFCIYVTFLEELSTFDVKTVSMVSSVAADGETRTYKILRQAADGKAYAISVAEHYHLRRMDILRRLSHEGSSVIPK